MPSPSTRPRTGKACHTHQHLTGHQVRAGDQRGRESLAAILWCLQPRPGERQLLAGLQKALLLSLIQLNPTTGKLFTVIYSNSALRL